MNSGPGAVRPSRAPWPAREAVTPAHVPPCPSPGQPPKGQGDGNKSAFSIWGAHGSGQLPAPSEGPARLGCQNGTGSGPSLKEMPAQECLLKDGSSFNRDLPSPSL